MNDRVRRLRAVIAQMPPGPKRDLWVQQLALINSAEAQMRAAYALIDQTLALHELREDRPQ